jgi:hypothetical protein
VRKAVPREYLERMDPQYPPAFEQTAKNRSSFVLTQSALGFHNPQQRTGGRPAELLTHWAGNGRETQNALFDW